MGQQYSQRMGREHDLLIESGRQGMKSHPSYLTIGEDMQELLSKDAVPDQALFSVDQYPINGRSWNLR